HATIVREFLMSAPARTPRGLRVMHLVTPNRGDGAPHLVPPPAASPSARRRGGEACGPRVLPARVQPAWLMLVDNSHVCAEFRQRPSPASRPAEPLPLAAPPR